MEWVEDRQDEGRPQPPPNLTLTTAQTLFSNPGLQFLSTHPGLPSSRHRVLSCLPSTLRKLEEAERLYSDDSPKSRVGQAHEWNECRAAVEELLNLGRAYLALVMEEEGD